jgi:hypothetical protein
MSGFLASIFNFCQRRLASVKFLLNVWGVLPTNSGMPTDAGPVKRVAVVYYNVWFEFVNGPQQTLERSSSDVGPEVGVRKDQRYAVSQASLVPRFLNVRRRGRNNQLDAQLGFYCPSFAVDSSFRQSGDF